jgi:hypothetical protein
MLPGLAVKVFVEPRGVHDALRQTVPTDKLHQIFRLGLGQHLLEGGVGIALLG